LHSAALHLMRQVAAVDAVSGLSPARLSALSVLVYGGPRTMSALARTERVSAATMSSTVSGLAAAGLVVRGRTGADARSVEVSATPAGRHLLARARTARLAVLLDGLARLTPGERRVLQRAVGVLERLLHQGSCPDGPAAGTG